MIRVTHAQLATAALIATAVHGAVLAAMAIHETPMPEKPLESAVVLELAALGDPLGELDPQAPPADERLAVSSDRPEVEAENADTPALPMQPPPTQVAAIEAEAPDLLDEVTPIEPVNVTEPQPDILPETPERPDLNTAEATPTEPIQKPDPLPDDLTPLDPLPDPLTMTEAPPQPAFVEFMPQDALAPTMLPDHVERPDPTQDPLTNPDAPPPPDLTELQPPESLAPTVIPDTLEQPDPMQDPLQRPETVARPPELNDLAPAPDVFEPVTPVAPPDQPMLLPDPAKPADTPDEILVKAQPIARPPDPKLTRVRPESADILTEVPKLQPRVDEPDAVPPEPITVAALDRPFQPERAADLPNVLPRPEPVTDLPKPQPTPQEIRTAPQPVSPPSTVAPQINDMPAPRQVERASVPREIASAAAVIPPSVVPRSAVNDDVRKAYAGSLYRRINSVATRNYPHRAAQRGEEGFVPVRLEVGSTGELLSVTVLDDSHASSRLVKAALNAVQESAPFSPFSPEMGLESATFDVRIHYRLR